MHWLWRGMISVWAGLVAHEIARYGFLFPSVRWAVNLVWRVPVLYHLDRVASRVVSYPLDTLFFGTLPLLVAFLVYGLLTQLMPQRRWGQVVWFRRGWLSNVALTCGLAILLGTMVASLLIHHELNADLHLFIAAGSGGLVSSLAYALVTRHPESPETRCPECGYDLRGNVSGICPECGHPTSGGQRSTGAERGRG